MACLRERPVIVGKDAERLLERLERNSQQLHTKIKIRMEGK